MEKPLLRVFVYVCSFSSFALVASTIELKDARDLSKTLENTDLLIKTSSKRGDLLKARGDLSFDVSTGRFNEISIEPQKSDEKKNNLKIESMNAEGEFLEDQRLESLAVNQIGADKANTTKAKDTTSSLSGVKSLSSSGGLSSISQPTQSVLGLGTSGSNPSSSSFYSLGNKSLDGMSYGDFTRRAIDAVDQKTDRGNQASSGTSLASSKGAFQSFNSNSPSNSSSGISLSSGKGVSSNFSKSDIESFGDAFSGYDSVPNVDYGNSSLSNSSNTTTSNNDPNKQGENHADSQGSSENSAADKAKPNASTPSKITESTNGSETPKPPVNCQAAKDDFYGKFNNTGSYTLKEIVTDKDGKQRQQYCIKPQKDDLFDVYSGLGNLESSCSQEVGAVFYGSDAESACIWVDVPSAGNAGAKTHNLPDLFDNSSAENFPANVPSGNSNQRHVK